LVTYKDAAFDKRHWLLFCF